MERKVVLLVLIVIAVVTAIFLGVGLARGDDDFDIDPDQYAPSLLLARMDSLFARSRDSLDLRRMTNATGCTLEGRSLVFAVTCEIVIDTSASKSSEFVLVSGSGAVTACFTFDADGHAKCRQEADQRSRLEKARTRFVLTQDSAFLRLDCLGSASQPCRVGIE